MATTGPRFFARRSALSSRDPLHHTDGRSAASGRLAAGAALLHVLVAVAQALRGVSIRHDFGPSTWDWFWQNLPAVELRERALQSLWHLHAQPPLWNTLNAVLIKLFGEAHLSVLYGLQVGLGAATAGMAVLLATRLTGSRVAGVVAGALVALDPALVLYEAYAMYTLLAAFLVLLAVFTLARAGPAGRTGPLLLSLAAITALVLTRSVFHLGLLLLFIAGAAAIARRRRVVLVAGLAMALLPAGWYAKNVEQYGFFGASSWYGIGLWRVALFRYASDEVSPLLIAGELDPVVSVPPFSLPSHYRGLGYTAESEIPSLARDDFHNVNVPAISAAYAKSARTLILHAPVHFLANVAVGYGNFSAPSTEFAHLGPDRDHMGVQVTAWRLLTGLPLARWVDRALPFGTTGSLFLVLIPFGLLVHGWLVWRRIRGGEPAAQVFREEAALLGGGVLILYTAAVGSALELGENVRFKFMIEPLLLVYWTVLATRWWAERRRAGVSAPSS